MKTVENKDMKRFVKEFKHGNKCCICGKFTKYIELCTMQYVCSMECIEKCINGWNNQAS